MNKRQRKKSLKRSYAAPFNSLPGLLRESRSLLPPMDAGLNSLESFNDAWRKLQQLMSSTLIGPLGHPSDTISSR